MAKVIEIVVLTLMPISWAAPLSSDTARMAVPILVLVVKRVRPTMMMMHAATVTTVVIVMDSSPPNSLNVWLPTTEVKVLGFAPQILRAAFCRK